MIVLLDLAAREDAMVARMSSSWRVPGSARQKNIGHDEAHPFGYAGLLGP